MTDSELIAIKTFAEIRDPQATSRRFSQLPQRKQGDKARDMVKDYLSRHIMNDTKRATAAYIVSHKTTALDAQRIGKAFEYGAKWAIQATIDWLECLNAEAQRSGSARGGDIVEEMIEDYKRKML